MAIALNYMRLGTTNRREYKALPPDVQFAKVPT